MSKYILYLVLFVYVVSLNNVFAQIKLDNKTLNQAVNTVNKSTSTPTKISTPTTAAKVVTAATSSTSLSNSDIIKGLKEALTKGSDKSTTNASAVDGFYKNALIKVPFPPDIVAVEKRLRSMGMGSMVDQFILKLNRTAEDATKKAAPIFVSAITNMTVTDGMAILKGSNNAATNYLNQKTSTQLTSSMSPVVQQSLNNVQLLKYWTPLATKYNAIPGIKKVNPDLSKYVTQRTIDGLFKLIAKEEEQIRLNPAARTTDLLKQVFGQ